jgi:hypothetical protein
MRIFRLAKAAKALDALQHLLFGGSTAMVNAEISREAHRERQSSMAKAGVLELVENTLQRTDLPHCIRLGALELGVRLLEFGNSEVQTELLAMSVRSNNNNLLRNCVALMLKTSEAATEVFSLRCKVDESKSTGGGTAGGENQGARRSKTADKLQLDAMPLLAPPFQGGESAYSVLLHETAMTAKFMQQVHSHCRRIISL